MDVALHQNISYTSNLSQREGAVYQDICPGLQAQNAVLGVTLLVGTVGSICLLVLILNHRKHQWTPDKVLILNLAVTDLLACLSSLPLHLLLLNTKPSSWSSAVCVARFYTMFTCFAINIMTMAAISVDRYDALCCIPQRKLTLRNAFSILAFIWTFALCSTAAGGSVILISHLENSDMCITFGKIITTRKKVGNSIMIAVVGTWIFPSLGVMSNRFVGIMRYVQEHSQQIRQVLGIRQTRREINLTKTCMGFILTYLILWVGFAICIVLRNMSTSLGAHCAYLWAYSLAYLSFTAVPIEYIIMDKRFGKRRQTRVGNVDSSNAVRFSQRTKDRISRSEKTEGNAEITVNDQRPTRGGEFKLK